MPTIDIKRSHPLGKDKARAAVEQVAEKLRDKFGLSTNWDGDTLRFERSGAKGAIAVTDADVHVTVDLGMMMRPMKGTIETKIKEYLDQYLGSKD